MTPHRNDLKTELDEKLDTSFLEHLFTEKALDPVHFCNLIFFLLNKVEMYAAPCRDNQIKEWKESVMKRMENEIIYSDFIPEFFEKLYSMIDILENDIKVFYESNKN
jgi:hypothetical protein